MVITSFRNDLYDWDSRNTKPLPPKIRKLREKWEKQCLKEERVMSEWIIHSDEQNRLEKFKLKNNFYK